MQVCKRIHSQVSSGAETSTTPGALTARTSLHKCGYRILLEICEFLLQLSSRDSVGSSQLKIICKLISNVSQSLYSFNHHQLFCLFSAVSRGDVLPRGQSVLCLQTVTESQNLDQSTAQSSSSSSSSAGDTRPHISGEQDDPSAECSLSDHQWALLHQDSPLAGLLC